MIFYWDYNNIVDLGKIDSNIYYINVINLDIDIEIYPQNRYLEMQVNFVYWSCIWKQEAQWHLLNKYYWTNLLVWVAFWGLPACVSTQWPQSFTTVCDPMDCSPPSLLCPWDSPGKNIGVGCHALLQRIFLTQEVNFLSCVSCIAGRLFTTESLGKLCILW